MKKRLFSRACLSLVILLMGGAAGALPHAELAAQLKPSQMLGGHLAFRTEHCRVLVLRSGEDSVLLVLPESGEQAGRVSRVARRLAELLFAGQEEELDSFSVGDGTLVLPTRLREELGKAGCLGGSGVQTLVSLIAGGGFRHVVLNDRGRVVLRTSETAGAGLQFYPAVAQLNVLEVVGKISDRQSVFEITEALGYGDAASRSTHERLARNLKCQVLFYNSEDEALMAERGGRVYVGQRDVVRKLMEGGKVPRAVLKIPEEMAELPQAPVPPPPPMPGAAEALEAYLKYLREL